MITDHRGSDQIKDARMSQSIHTLHDLQYLHTEKEKEASGWGRSVRKKGSPERDKDRVLAGDEPTERSD
jgi:hypothetical protein